jgi:hypothetical protein
MRRILLKALKRYNVKWVSPKFYLAKQKLKALILIWIYLLKMLKNSIIEDLKIKRIIKQISLIF